MTFEIKKNILKLEDYIKDGPEFEGAKIEMPKGKNPRSIRYKFHDNRTIFYFSEMNPKTGKWSERLEDALSTIYKRVNHEQAKDKCEYYANRYFK